MTYFKKDGQIDIMEITEQAQMSREAFVNAKRDKGEYNEEVRTRMVDGAEQEVHIVEVDLLSKEMWYLFKDISKWKDGTPIFNPINSDKGVKQMADRLRAHYNRNNIEGFRDKSENTGKLNSARGGKLWLYREDAEETLQVYSDLALKQSHHTHRVEDMPFGRLAGKLNGKKLKRVSYDQDPKIHEKVVLETEEKRPELPPLPIVEDSIEEKDYIVSLNGDDRIIVKASSILGAKSKAFDQLGFQIKAFDLKGSLAKG